VVLVDARALVERESVAAALQTVVAAVLGFVPEELGVVDNPGFKVDAGRPLLAG
jgi:hypothetical protein